ncbi:MAG: hypothetical protein WCP69_11865 [Bacteroidota bacterium]
MKKNTPHAFSLFLELIFDALNLSKSNVGVEFLTSNPKKMSLSRCDSASNLTSPMFCLKSTNNN